MFKFVQVTLCKMTQRLREDVLYHFCHEGFKLKLQITNETKKGSRSSLFIIYYKRQAVRGLSLFFYYLLSPELRVCLFIITYKTV